ncbi:hypothetical protein ACB094_03G120400 [Castanea mollissima]
MDRLKVYEEYRCFLNLAVCASVVILFNYSSSSQPQTEKRVRYRDNQKKKVSYDPTDKEREERGKRECGRFKIPFRTFTQKQEIGKLKFEWLKKRCHKHQRKVSAHIKG